LDRSEIFPGDRLPAKTAELVLAVLPNHPPLFWREYPSRIFLFEQATEQAGEDLFPGLPILQCIGSFKNRLQVEAVTRPCRPGCVQDASASGAGCPRGTELAQ
jgi:hypothetical protein